MNQVSVCLDLYAALNVFIVAVSVWLKGYRAERKNRLFLQICGIAILMLVSDAAVWAFMGLDKPWYPVAERVAQFVQYASDFIMLPFFAHYVARRIGRVSSVPRTVPRVVSWITAFGLLLLVITQFTGWYYYYDAENIYHRGPLFAVSQGCIVVIVALVCITIFRKRHVLPRIESLILATYGLLPLVGAAAQVLFFGLSTTYLATAISVLLGYIGIQSRDQEELRQRSERDNLTYLFNRNKLESMRKSDYRELESCGVIWFDINELKTINDTYGHAAGDQLIKLAADSVRSITGRDVHAYRMGGDEFMVVACNMGMREIDGLIRLWDSRLSYLNEYARFPCTMAYGRAWGEAPINLDELIRQADENMYDQKQDLKDVE